MKRKNLLMSTYPRVKFLKLKEVYLVAFAFFDKKRDNVETLQIKFNKGLFFSLFLSCDML